jgi:hypothetical protein
VKTIEVIISATGETKLETKGFAGAECQAASRELEQALGQRTSEQVTGEFYASSIEQSQQHEAL